MGQGSVCGAVTGAAMVLGLATADRADEQEARYVTYDLVCELTERFRLRRGTLGCRELLGGVDLATDEGRREAERRDLFRFLCPGIVRDAVEILDELTSAAGPLVRPPRRGSWSAAGSEGGPQPTQPADP